MTPKLFVIGGSVVCTILLFMLYLSSVGVNEESVLIKDTNGSNEVVDYTPNVKYYPPNLYKTINYPTFKVGEKLVYSVAFQSSSNSISENMSGRYVHEIRRITTCGARKCYHIISNITKYTGYSFNVETYIDVENGEIIEVIIDNDTKVKEESAGGAVNTIVMSGMFPYSDWMLSLDKDLIFNEKLYTNKPLPQKFYIEYEVLNEEQINGRDCFKIEVDATIELTRDSMEQKNRQKSTLWVDKKERILVKAITYAFNNPLEEINII